MPNSIAARVSFCCVLTRRTFPWPKTRSADPWTSPEPNKRRRSSCAAQLDLRTSIVQMAKPRQYLKCSHQFLLISARSEICPKSKKRKPCSSVDKLPGPATGDRCCRVGWVERSDTHHVSTSRLMGIAALHPSYGLPVSHSV